MPRLLPLLFLALPVAAASQTARQEKPDYDGRFGVRFPAPQAKGEGFSSAVAWVQYSFIACAGVLKVAVRLDPEFTATGPYWYDGVAYPLGADFKANRPRTLSVAVTVGNAHGSIANVRTSVGTAAGMDCFSGDLISLGPIGQLTGKSMSRQELVQFVRRLTLSGEGTSPAVDVSLRKALIGRKIGAHGVRG